MAKRKNDTKKLMLQEWMRRHGYKEDRYGNFMKVDGGLTVRFKFQDISLRKEFKMGSGEWARARSALYRDVEITADDRLNWVKLI